MTVRRHTKVRTDGERWLGEPKLQLALSASRCLFPCAMYDVSRGLLCHQLPAQFHTV